MSADMLLDQRFIAEILLKNTKISTVLGIVPYVCFRVLKNNVLFQFEIEGFGLIDKFLLQYSRSIGQEIEKKKMLHTAQ
jgi:hypothetical protein